MLPGMIQSCIVVFLLFNIYIKTTIILVSNHLLAYPLMGIFIICFFAVNNEKIKDYLFLLFGFSLFLFGFRSGDIQSQFFEFSVACIAIVLLLEKRNENYSYNVRGNYFIIIFILYFLIALFSLLLLPVSDFFSKIILWGISDFAFYVMSASPDLPEYSLAAVNRLGLFFLAAGLLICSGRSAEKHFLHLFKGAAWGLVVAALLGLFEYFNFLSLSWYVPAVHNKLHSTFLNRGWYSEYAICLTPLLFLGRCSSESRFRSVFAGLAVLLIGISILFTGARTGWILFGVVVAGLVTIFCGQGRLLRNLFKGIGFSLLVMVVLVALSFALLKTSQRIDGVEGTHASNISEKQTFLKKRLVRFFQTGRIKNWQDTLHIIDGSYLVGRGYESFSWQGHVLNTISSSSYKKYQRYENIRDTSHNFFLQIIVSNGLVGLITWFALAGTAAFILFKDYKINNNCQSGIMLLCLSVFHLYGLTQSMQYIPMIWFLVFIFIGYAMLRSMSVWPGIKPRFFRYALSVSIVCCLSAVSSYAFNIGNQLEARRYGIDVFAVDQDSYLYRGFHAKESWVGQGIYRWSGRQAEIVLNGSGLVGLNFVCYAPRLQQKPIVLDVFLDDLPIDRYTFWKTGKIYRTYWVQPRHEMNERKIRIEVSRTWNPLQEGLGRDIRNLGVAVSELKYFGKELKKDLGLKRWELEKIEDNRADHRLVRYRWSSIQATLSPEKKKNFNTLLLKSEQPYLRRQPLEVTFRESGRDVALIRLTDYGWHEIAFPKSLSSGAPLIIRVNRTWNPKREGYGDDFRDLGVAAVFLTTGKKNYEHLLGRLSE